MAGLLACRLMAASNGGMSRSTIAQTKPRSAPSVRRTEFRVRLPRGLAEFFQIPAERALELHQKVDVTVLPTAATGYRTEADIMPATRCGQAEDLGLFLAT